MRRKRHNRCEKDTRARESLGQGGILKFAQILRNSRRFCDWHLLGLFLPQHPTLKIARIVGPPVKCQQPKRAGSGRTEECVIIAAGHVVTRVVCHESVAVLLLGCVGERTAAGREIRAGLGAAPALFGPRALLVEAGAERVGGGHAGVVRNWARVGASVVCATASANTSNVRCAHGVVACKFSAAGRSAAGHARLRHLHRASHPGTDLEAPRKVRRDA
jgi:hypothetical protein